MSDSAIHHVETVKHVGDALSISAILGTLAGWLPEIAAFLSIVWTCIRIYETKTVQAWFGKKRGRHEAR